MRPVDSRPTRSPAYRMGALVLLAGAVAMFVSRVVVTGRSLVPAAVGALVQSLVHRIDLQLGAEALILAVVSRTLGAGPRELDLMTKENPARLLAL